jgi:hypothetical protein
MRCILRMLVVLALASPAWAAQDTAPSTARSQEPAVSTPVPNIHAPGAPAVTAPSSSSADTYQTPASERPATAPAPAPTTTAPASVPATRYYGNYAVGAGTTFAAPMSNSTYVPYYYPMRTRFGLFRWVTPTYNYSSVNAGPTYGTVTYGTPGQTYYTPVQTYYVQPRGVFGLFQRRYRPAYQTTVYTGPAYTTPVYTPTTYTVPAGTVTGGTVPAVTTPVYTPTTYTVPTGTAPAGALPAGTTRAATAPAATAPAGTAPAGADPERTSPAATAPATTAPAGSAPARTIPPPPPPIKPKVEGDGP